jgi:hypothetical protein
MAGDVPLICPAGKAKYFLFFSIPELDMVSENQKR